MRFYAASAAYRRILAEPDAATWAAIFASELAAPFSGLTQLMGGGPESFTQWVMEPEQLG